jgi:hypothetical protein
VLIDDRNGDKHDPLDVADFLDAQGDRSCADIGESLHDAADVVRGLRYQLYHALGEPWPLRDVLVRLADAAEHLLRDHDCDTHGYEGIKEATQAARRILRDHPPTETGDEVTTIAAQLRTSSF